MAVAARPPFRRLSADLERYTIRSQYCCFHSRAQMVLDRLAECFPHARLEVVFCYLRAKYAVWGTLE